MGPSVIAEQSGSNQTAVIVGGGVIGIACAHYLKQAGYQVTVVDRDSIGGACSHANCGYVCPSHVLPLTVPSAIPMALKSLLKPKSPFKVKFSLSPNYVGWMLQFGRRCREQVALAAGHHLKSILDSSLNEYKGLITSERLDCQWKESGLLHVFQTQSALDGFAKENDWIESEYQCGAKRISAADLPTLDSTLRSDLAGGFLHEEDASLRPDLLNQTWRAKLENEGVRFIENCNIETIARDASGKVQHLVTSQGQQNADVYVFAIGAWSEEIGSQLGFKLPIQPGKGYSITLDKPDVSPTIPMLFPEKKIGVSPFANGFRIGSMMEFVGFDETIPEYRVQQLKDSVRPFFNFQLNETEQERWYGYRPMTYDTLPVIGQAPGVENSFIATGHSMLGVSMAPATGRLIAEMILKQPTHIDAQAFSPARF